MNTQLNATIVGKIKTPLTSVDRNGKTFNKFAVTTRIRSYSHTQGKTLWSPVTVFVTVFGTINDRLAQYLRTEGNGVVIMNGSIEVSVAMKDNDILRYNSGDRRGEPMYNYNLTTNSDSIAFTQPSGDETERAPAASAATNNARNNNQSDDSDGWL